ncbi:PREDICTED: trichohyalin-like [Calidris pugnax]|uniref:trichohyalin-like n=2 Tax=Calidris pugnax TaxID=198806 RepID=UPI00071CF658|nr:PREDICTED: trichohyalin-like [Calidris pugnax]
MVPYRNVATPLQLMYILTQETKMQLAGAAVEMAAVRDGGRVFSLSWLLVAALVALRTRLARLCPFSIERTSKMWRAQNTSIQQTETRQPQGQRQASALEPLQGEPQACRDREQQELEPAQVLVSALKLQVEFLREENRKRLDQLQERERAVEQELQELAFLMQHYPKEGQRQASALEPLQGEPQACRDREQQELEPAQVLVSALKLQVEFLREENRKRLDQLQERERAVEQELQELAFLMQHYPKEEQKDEAVQTEVTSSIAAHSHADTSSGVLREERTELFGQVVVDAEMVYCRQEQTAEEQRYQPRDVKPGRAAERSSAEEAQAWSTLQRAEERPRSSMGKGTPCQANSQVEAKLQAGSSKAEQAQSREVAVQVQAELSQCQQKQQLSLEQELKHVHPASHAQEKVQKSLEQLQALREQLRAREEENWSLWCGLAWLQEELRATRSQGQQSEEERQQLRWELRKLQEQSKQEELSRQAQHWQQLYQDSQRALAAREEELVLCKVELAFFKEELSKAKKQASSRHTGRDAGGNTSLHGQNP